MHKKFGNDPTKIDRNMPLKPFRPTLRKRFSYRKRTIWHGSKNLEKWFELCYRRTRCKNLKQICCVITEIWSKECLQGLSKVKSLLKVKVIESSICTAHWSDMTRNVIELVMCTAICLETRADHDGRKRKKIIIKKRNCCKNNNRPR